MFPFYEDNSLFLMCSGKVFGFSATEQVPKVGCLSGVDDRFRDGGLNLSESSATVTMTASPLFDSQRILHLLLLFLHCRLE